MDQWDKEAMQDRILAGEQPSCAGESSPFSPGAGPYRWRCRFATGRGRGELDFGVMRMRLSFHAVSQVRK